LTDVKAQVLLFLGALLVSQASKRMRRDAVGARAAAASQGSQGLKVVKENQRLRRREESR
jgi:hypothetical protein